MKTKQLISASLLSVLAMNANAQDLSISVTNLTQGIHFTPLIVGAHTGDTSLFSVATTASSQLQMMAEGGDISGLNTMLTDAAADVMANPAEGLLAPAMSTSLTLNTTDGNNYLSLTAMMLPTNDGFVGLDSWMIPSEAGTYTIWLNAYDAGTEANDEMIVGGAGGAPGAPGIPAAPGGNGGANGSGVADTQSNANVHIHRGALGDDDLTGGQSDLDNRVHRWLNPVAKVTVTVQ
ncbi:MAG: hypothetical protein ACI8WB_004346 [Phenylobacterium sp.]|jgi:hypothetical protein